jgi:hypothetical protein
MPGVNPIRTYPDETRKKAKGPIRQEPQVIERYRHWLHDLDCQMQDRAEDAVSESIAKKEFFNRVDIFDQFRDKSKAMRQKWREFKQESSSMKQGSIRHPREEIKNHAHLPINYDQLILSVLSTSNKIEQNQVSRPSMKASKRKPAWARTENENELEQEKEIEGLVDFMDNFDAREYVEDVEVKSILANIQEKVKEHEASIRSEIKKKGLSETHSNFRVSSSKAENKNDINPFSGIQNNSNDRSKKGVAHPMPFRPSTSDPRKSMMEVIST